MALIRTTNNKNSGQRGKGIMVSKAYFKTKTTTSLKIGRWGGAVSLVCALPSQRNEVSNKHPEITHSSLLKVKINAF